MDDATAAKYLAQSGQLGKELKENLVHNEEGYHFRFDSRGKCHFFREDGLCRLILELGEESLCYICAQHPRFYATVFLNAEFELGGVGLCCEKTCELLLASEGLNFVVPGEAGKISLLELCQRLDLDFLEEELHYKPVLTAEYMELVLKCMSQTEPISDVWTADLNALRLRKQEVLLRSKDALNPETEALLDKVFQYILYRQLEFTDVYTEETLLDYAKLSTEFILYTSAFTGDLQEAVRRWSEQIEYDTENVEVLLGLLA